MTERRFGRGGPQDREKDLPPRIMEDGLFYDLNPASNIQGKLFHRVQCEYRVPSNPNEYVVRGVPEGGDKQESFLLRFTNRGVSVTISREQSFDTESDTPPPLRLE